MAQIFIAHSSKDRAITNRIAQKLDAIGISAYLAEHKSPTPASVYEKLRSEISKSKAVFLILTRNVTRSKNTSLTIQFEITTAQEKKIPVYVFAQKRTKVPLMIKLTQDYGTFDPVNEESLVEMIGRMESIGRDLKAREEQNRALMIRTFGESLKSLFEVFLGTVDPSKGRQATYQPMVNQSQISGGQNVGIGSARDVQIHQSPNSKQIQAGRDVNYYDQSSKNEPTAPEPNVMTLAQLGDRVYNPIVQELSKWGDPIQAGSSEWKRLQLAERRLVMKIPEPISTLLNQASELFAMKVQLMVTLQDYLNETTRSELIRSKLVLPDKLGNYEFRECGNGISQPVYLSWIWQYETDLSGYLYDHIQSQYPPKIQWGLQTWVYPPRGGVGVQIGGDTETRAVVNHVLRFLMDKPWARKLQAYNRQIKELGRTITSMIDEELKRA